MTTNQEKFLTVFEQQFAEIQAACRVAQICRSTFYNWLKNKEFKQAIDDIREGLLDNAESKLHELINGVTVKGRIDGKTTVYTRPPDFRAIAYFLDRKGRDRGYGEKVQTENTNNNTITVAIDYGDNLINKNVTPE